MEIKINPNIDLQVITNEPNFRMFKCNGHICVIIRNSTFGTYCGYVGVKKTSNCYGKPYYDNSDNSYVQQCISNLQIHGGLTYSNNNIISCFEDIFGEELWFFGFDCNHYNDLPVYSMFSTEGIYRDYQYVRENVVELSNQIKAIEDR